MSQHFLTDLLVLELGHRLAVSACGSVLSELGCEVVSVSSPGRHESDDLRAGKRSLQWHAPLAASADEALLLQLIARADVVLLSPDADPVWPPAIASALQQARAYGPAIVCDVSAFGLPAERKANDAGPLPLQPYSDGLLQAMSGILDTNGDQDKPPALCRAPIIEMASALYACSAVLAALLVQQRQGISQSVQTSMYNCAVSMLTTFLPKHFAGGKSPRIGNHHPSMSPWNAYRASDGWVLLCAGTNDQWRRVCELIGQAAGQGAQPLTDGRTTKVAAAPHGFFVGPTVLDHVRPEMVTMKEEVFGPVLNVVRMDDLDAAIELANSSPYGNGAAIFTRSGKAAREFRHRVQAGMVGINIGVPAPMAFFPFSGWHASFFGDLHLQGRESVAFFTQQKVTTTRWFAEGEGTIWAAK